jgi:hypothetical protein
VKFVTHMRCFVPAVALAVAAFSAAAAGGPDLHWAAASRGTIPKGSLAVGKDEHGKTLYACRARLANGADVPGVIREPLIGCSVVHGGLQWSIAAYQVLRDDPKAVHWASAASVPPRAYRVGNDVDGSALFLCRAKMADGSIRVGRLGAAGACVYGSGGKAESAADFEVLVQP